MTKPVDFKDLGISKLRADLARLRRTKITIGWQGESGDKLHPDANGLTITDVAAINHYGTSDGRIPPRPALDQTFEQNRVEFIRSARKLFADVADGRKEIDEAIEELGTMSVEELRRTMDSSRDWATPNKPSTIANKGHDQPLFGSTGQLRANTSWAAREDGDIVKQGGETGD